MRARRRRRWGPRFGRTRRGRRRGRARRRRRRRRRARGGTPREDRARARRGARRVEPRRRPRRVGTAATSRRTRRAETNARAVDAPSRARARRAKAPRSPRAVATRTTRATTSSPSSPRASRAWACAVARIFAADREGRQRTAGGENRTHCSLGIFSRLRICEYGPYIRALGGFAVPPPPPPRSGPFPFFFRRGARRTRAARSTPTNGLATNARTSTPRGHHRSPWAKTSLRKMWAPRRCARPRSSDPPPCATDRRPFRLTSRVHNSDARLALPVAAGYGGLRHSAREGHPDPRRVQVAPPPEELRQAHGARPRIPPANFHPIEG